MRAILILTIAATAATPAPAEGPAAAVELAAGGGNGPDGGAARGAAMKAPFGVDFGRDGSAYIIEMTGNRLRRVAPDGTISTLAGTGAEGNSGDGGPAARATFNGPHGLVVAPDGTVLIADTWNNRVRRVDPEAGTIDAFAGTGAKGDSGDGGPAKDARFGGVYAIALDPAGASLYVVDLDHRRVRAVDLASGVVSDVAGDGRKGVPEDGADARSSPLVDPRAVAVDASGTVYILERGGHALRAVGRDGTIRTVLGTGRPGDAFEPRRPLQTALNGPKHLCVDRDGAVLIADTENHRVLRYDPKTRTVARLVGSGKKGPGGVGGSPESVELDQPHGVAVGPDGALYISDSSNDRVLKLAR